MAFFQSFADEKHVQSPTLDHQICYPIRIDFVPFAQFRKPLVRFQCLRMGSVNVWIHLSSTSRKLVLKIDLSSICFCFVKVYHIRELMISPVTPSKFFAKIERIFFERSSFIQSSMGERDFLVLTLEKTTWSRGYVMPPTDTHNFIPIFLCSLQPLYHVVFVQSLFSNPIHSGRFH